MAFIEYLAPSPKQGIREHVARPTALALIAAGFAIAVEPSRLERFPKMDEPTPATVNWGVKRPQIGKGLVALVGTCSNGNCSTLRFEGEPGRANTIKFVHSCGGGQPVEVPAEAIAAYKAAREGTEFEYTSDMQHFFAARQPGDSNKHATVDHGNGKSTKF